MTPDEEMQNFLQSITNVRKKPVRKSKHTGSNEWKKRYEDAYRKNFEQEYPLAYKQDGYIKTVFPKTDKANGLTQAIIKFLMWSGHRATRITSAGRMIGTRFIPGTTRKGAADVSSTINGRSVMWEVKMNDQPSPEQLREQELERKSGGEYFFVHNMDEFFKYYDELFV